MMNLVFRTITAGVATLILSATVSAQLKPGPQPIHRSGNGVPGAGYVEVLGGSAPAPTPTGLQSAQPAECLAECQRTEGPWVLVAPSIWVFDLQGEIGVGNRIQQMDMSLSDAIDEVSEVRGAVQLHVEAGYGDIGLIADLTHWKVEPFDPLVSVEQSSTVFELLGMYRVVNTGRGAGGMTFDVLAGGRYYRFRNSIGGTAGLLSAEQTDDWIDVVVGARVGLQILDCLGIFARGDAGGFSIGDSSQKACNILVGFEYRCCECASLMGGYRWFQIERQAGEGRDAFLYDATMSGPFVGFGLRY